MAARTAANIRKLENVYRL